MAMMHGARTGGDRWINGGSIRRFWLVLSLLAVIVISSLALDPTADRERSAVDIGSSFSGVH